MMFPSKLSRLRDLSPLHETMLAWSGLVIVVLCFYHEILTGFFITDDYAYLVRLLSQAHSYSQGKELGDWFFAFNGIVFLRPIVQWSWLTDFIAWSRDATGYYFTNILLHALNACLVYLLARRTLGSRLGAVAASILFALHPMHADSVAWISDRVDLLSAFFSLQSAVFFVLYRQRSRKLYFLISLIAFALAALTKESTLTLPLVLFVYDLLFTFPHLGWKMVRAQLVMVMSMLGYVALRLVLFHGVGGYSDQGFLKFGWILFLEYYTMALASPFIPDMNLNLLFVVLSLLAIFMMVYRNRKGMWLGLAWVGIMLIPAGSAEYVAPRLTYIPSIGLAIAEGAFLATLLPRTTNLSRALGIAWLVILSIAYAFGLSAKVDAWATIGNITASIQQGVKRLYPAFPPDSRVYFIGIPGVIRGLDVYAGNFPLAMNVIYYGTPKFSLFYADKFPIVADGLEQSYFLEYHRQTIIERKDIQKVLMARTQCLGYADLKVDWEFSQGANGWEPWNDLAGFETQNDVLVTRSLGHDPYMASPLIDVATMQLGDIAITMRASANVPQLHGSLYWRTADMQDFFPALNEPFDVIPDGEFHTYHLDIAKTGKLFVGDTIAQLRLDPADQPADIGLKSIQLYTHCSRVQENGCQCR